GEWPFYGRDLSNSRNGGTSGPSYNEVPTLGPVWSFASSDGDFTGTPVVARGKLVVASGGGSVFALDAASGKKLWSKDLNAPINGTAAIAGGRVYVPVATPGSPTLAAFDLGRGALLWRTRLDSQKNSDVFGSPVVWSPKRPAACRARAYARRHRARCRSGPAVYIGTSAEYGEVNDPKVNTRGSVVALDAATGRVRWKTFSVPPKHDGGAVWNTPAIDTATGRLYVGPGNAYHTPAAT